MPSTGEPFTGSSTENDLGPILPFSPAINTEDTLHFLRRLTEVDVRDPEFDADPALVSIFARRGSGQRSDFKQVVGSVT